MPKGGRRMAQLGGALPSRKIIHERQQRYTELDARRTALRAEGDAMIARFREGYPDAPAYLVRYADRTLSDYRWRLSSAGRWRREDRPAKINYPVDLTGEAGADLLSRLPAVTRKHWLELENQRIRLNFESALVKYERMRVRSLIDQLEKLRKMLKNTDGRSF